MSQFALMRWKGGAWVEAKRGDDAWSVRKGEDGSPGDDWTVRCLGCGNDSKFYGCVPCAKAEETADLNGSKAADG